MNVNISETAILDCVISGNPLDPTSMITWSLPTTSGKDLVSRVSTEFIASSGTSRLLIADITADDGGVYQCSVANGVGESVSSNGTIKLIVKGL